MLSGNDLKCICTVSELAKKLGLSRARFYQLQRTGVFPKPVYCIRTKHPFYPLDLQQECVEIRKTGMGHNGQPVIFYRTLNKSRKSQCQEYEELADILNQVGLTVNPNKVKNAVETLYPDKLVQDQVKGTVVRDLFRYFQRRV